MTSPEIEQRLRERDANWQAQCDEWERILVEDYGRDPAEAAASFAHIRLTLDRQAADALAEMRKALDQARDSNARDFRIAVERSCDEHLSSLKHDLRAAEAALALAREALEPFVKLAEGEPDTAILRTDSKEFRRARKAIEAIRARSLQPREAASHE